MKRHIKYLYEGNVWTFKHHKYDRQEQIRTKINDSLVYSSDTERTYLQAQMQVYLYKNSIV